MTEPRAKALLVVISGPSGTGKTTLCDRLVRDFDTLSYSVSCTTRPPRDGEIDGEDYCFLDRDGFNRLLSEGDFLEHAEVFGCMYGTLKSTVYDCLGSGRDVLMDIDVQGAAQIRDAARGAPPGDSLRDALVDVFIAPPSIESLDARLRGRGTDRTEIIEHRIQKAADEMSRWIEYQYLIVNDAIEESYEILRAILIAEHHKVRAGRPAHVR